MEPCIINAISTRTPLMLNPNLSTRSFAASDVSAMMRFISTIVQSATSAPGGGGTASASTFFCIPEISSNPAYPSLGHVPNFSFAIFENKNIMDRHAIESDHALCLGHLRQPVRRLENGARCGLC